MNVELMYSLDSGLKHLEEGHPEAALPLLQRAVQEDKSSSRTHLALATALDSLEREAEAIPHYRHALQCPDLSPADRTRAKLGLGSSLRLVGQLEESARILSEACNENPGHTSLRMFYALTLTDLGLAGDAVRELGELLLNLTASPDVLEYGDTLRRYLHTLGPAPRKKPLAA